MSINLKRFFAKVEAFNAPSVVLFRSIELRLVKEKIIDKLRFKKALDLGCGDGITAEIVFDKKVEYGIDNSELFLNLAKSKGVYRKLILADAEKMPLKNGVCDLVFSNCVVEHIKDLDSIMKESSRVLVKNGSLVFTSLTENFRDYSVFSFLNWRGLGKKYGRFRDRRLQHYHGYSLKDWSKRLEKYGFKVVDWFYYLDKETIEYWDLLMLVSYFLRIISLKLDEWVYKKLFRKPIYEWFVKARAVDSQGAAIGILAKKV